MENEIPVQAIIAFKNKINQIEVSLKNDTSEVSKNILKRFLTDKKKMLLDFQNEVDNNYAKYDREYFGYCNQNSKQILVIYIPKEIPIGILFAEIKTLPLMSYNIETGIVIFPDN